MILGMSLANFTLLHVGISLIGIVAGIVTLFGMLQSTYLKGATTLFLVTTILTSVTGFFFPFTKLLPSHIVGIISLVVLAIAVIALYTFRLSGSWRWIYVAGATLALYLNMFVLTVQSFLKVNVLKQMAPTQSEPPFLIAQGVLLIVFLALFLLAVRAFRPPTPAIR